MKTVTLKVQWMDGWEETYENVSYVSNEDECIVLTSQEGQDISIPVNNVRLFVSTEVE